MDTTSLITITLIDMKKIIFGLILITAIGIWGCDKSSTLPDRTTIIPSTSAFIKAMHMSPDAPLFNMYVDSIRAITVLESAPDVETGIAFGSVVPSLSNSYSYSIVPGGTHAISAKVPSTSTTLAGQTILTKSSNLVQGKYYTIAVVDSLSKLDAVIVEDDLNVPDTSKAYFRIANFLVRGSADVEFTGTNNFTRNGIAFKNVTSFETVPQGSYKIFLRANGATAKLDSITSFAPLKGKKYTLYSRGVVGQTGSTNTKRPLISQIQNL